MGVSFLRNKTQDDVVIAQGKLNLDYKNSFYTEHGAENVGFVTLHYATFPYAVVATVEVVFFSKYDGYDTIDYNRDDYYGDYAVYDTSAYRNGMDESADVYGTVAAHTSFPGSGSNDGDNSSILLNLSRDQCVPVKSRSFIELSRSVVAVPVHSKSCPLNILVNFAYSSYGSKLAEGVLQFSAHESGVDKKDVVGENGRIRVRVNWGDAYQQRYRGSDLKPITETEAEELIKKTENKLPQSPTSSWLARPIHILEVFSFGIGRNDLQPPFKICGTIRLPFYPLFHKDESSPQICNDNKLEVRYCDDQAMWAFDDFGFYVDIRDVETDFRVKGQCAWPSRYLESWFDKRVCSFIRGDHGYVAVHFTVIYEGLQAQFNIFLKRININNDTLDLSSSKLYGSIVAQYSNHDYSNVYDEKYYQSVLFESNTDNPVKLNEDGLLPLSKSLVCVPIKSSLIIKANLTVDGVGVDVLQGIVEFNAVDGPSSKGICGHKHCVNILVNWPPFF
ncbi:uncharacterized protein LOC110715429 [Chenopodium quinoa]|uniref:uncharacterized protein LOC110715429 n=1 Tax=Chenopodium quinoa TaxID=63459 RepID=UPI000B799209|nr:uncharacterized protein LOC110715429 [Chenopodium quinoa]